MATISSTGVGSGLQVNDLVAQLVAAERAPYDARINRADTRITSEFSALSQLKAAMASFQSALTTLKDTKAFALKTVTVGDDDAFSATADGSAAAGRYDVEIQKLALAAQLKSDPFVGGATTAIGTGTLMLTMGGAAFSVTLDAAHNTLADVRDAINSASGNPGVRATLIKGSDGTRLVLTGSRTGATNSITVHATGGDGGLAQLEYVPSGTMAMESIADAQDAVVMLSGIEIHSADNTIEDAIDGVTLTLKKAELGTDVALTVANDDTGVQGRVSGFVSAYNVLAAQIAKLRSYDPETKVAGPMLGDPMLRGIEAQLRRIVSDPVSTATQPYTTLASVGITTTATGTLTLDATKFNAAMAANPAVASSLFGSTDGVARRLDTFLTSHLATGGDITLRDGGIATRRKDLTRQKDALDARMAVIQARYLKQFNALDSLLTRMQSTSSYLASQLSQSASSSNS
ncbi:MAG: flagellar filament capping protein FliD [Pseudomonadota bacterium]